ncbi:chemotaxis protein CheW [Sporanaerobium hydrogeniformans]|uniref:Chemotaxis protein CheW n=1 Tax=Sporanaerobium hydrogeniformans TaxID=3072179 RepID=A0AC61DBG2_9FIRM|nr:chemotaxis protein CheW [Sporanaerobium hydrogeniformans]PHV70362.1 chemotaxis protein CheW [Sporanaerobium hydrogeniformans]
MLTKQIVIFKLCNQEYGIDIMKVLEISSYEPVRQVPDVPKYIEGIINVRGTIYPILNLREKLHLAPHPKVEESKFILMNLESSKVGFMVDNVCEILSIAQEEVEMTPQMLRKYESKYIEGVIKKGERIILILDVDLLLNDQEEKAKTTTDKALLEGK